MLLTERPHVVKNVQYSFKSSIFSSPIFVMVPLFWVCLSEMFDGSPKLGFLWELLSQLKDELVRKPKFDGW